MQVKRQKQQSKRRYKRHTSHLTLVTAVFFKNNLFNINQDAASKIKNHKIINISLDLNNFCKYDISIYHLYVNSFSMEASK